MAAGLHIMGGRNIKTHGLDSPNTRLNRGLYLESGFMTFAPTEREPYDNE